MQEGELARYIPALAEANVAHFGICVASTGGLLFEAGDPAQAFSIQSLSKPFLFALLCQVIGEDEARDRLGVISTGLPFNAAAHLDRSRCRHRP